MINSLEFVMIYSMFFLFITQITGMAGVTLISGMTTTVTAPIAPELSGWAAIINAIVWVGENIVFFFQLMLISTEYALFGTLILTPMVIGLIWAVLSLVRGTGT